MQGGLFGDLSAQRGSAMTKRNPDAVKRELASLDLHPAGWPHGTDALLRNMLASRPIPTRRQAQIQEAE
jgi:hypothetical protein